LHNGTLGILAANYFQVSGGVDNDGIMLGPVRDKFPPAPDPLRYVPAPDPGNYPLQSAALKKIQGRNTRRAHDVLRIGSGVVFVMAVSRPRF
jgi:hypothetical protein